MKIKSILTALFAATAISQAVVVNVSTGFDVGFIDNAGNPIAADTGYVGVGTVSDLTLLTPADLQGGTSTFNAFGSSITFGNAGFEGFVTGDISGPRVADGDAFANQGIFVVLGNGATLAESTEFAVVDASSIVFPVDDGAPTPAEASVAIATTSNLVLGSLNGTYSVAGLDIPAIQMVAIPEPSAALLAGLAFVGGLVRRRR